MIKAPSVISWKQLSEEAVSYFWTKQIIESSLKKMHNNLKSLLSLDMYLN